MLIDTRFSIVPSDTGGTHRELRYCDRPALLAGPAQDAVQKQGHNFVRFWLMRPWFATRGMPSGWTDGKEAYPFYWDAAKGKWDVTRISTSYMSWLSGEVNAAAAAGRVVMISLFNSFDFRTDGDNNNWPHSAWNPINNVNGAMKQKSGSTLFETFYGDVDQPVHDPLDDMDLTLGETQNAYVNAIGLSIKSWNVFFEIINEPQHAARDVYLGFLSRIAGTLRNFPERLVFHNDLPLAQDITYWKNHPTAFPNYDAVHGVTFHGVDPATFDPQNYPCRVDKVLQVSTDALASKGYDTDGYANNKAWASHLLGLPGGVIYEGYTLDPQGAQGILDAHPRPSELRAPRMPDHLAATVDTTRQVTVTWAQVAGASGYHLFRADTAAGLVGAAPYATVAGGATVSYSSAFPAGWHGYIGARAYVTPGGDSALATTGLVTVP